MARSNSFEGGSNGVTITSGNSGGASGDALDTVDNGGTGTVAFSSAQAAHGSLSMLVSTTAVSSLAYGGYTLSSVTTDYMRCYIRLTSLPGVVQVVARYMSGGSQALRVNVKSAGTLEIRDAANGVPSGGTTTAAVSTGVWWRLEMLTTFSATVGVVQLRLYNTADGTSITDSLNVTGLALTASATALRYGVGAAAASVPTTYFDDIAVEGATWHGPAVQTITISGLAIPLALGTPAPAQAFSVTPTGIAVPASLGTPAVTQAFTVVPDGIAVPASLGTPAVAQPMTVTPDGLAVPVQLGNVAVSTPPPVTTIVRPNTGTTARPSTGTVTRPFTGTVSRP